MNHEPIELIRFSSNELVVSEVVGETDDYVTLVNPVALVPTKEGSINFVPWCSLGETGGEVRVYTSNVIYYAEPGEELIKNYKEIFSTIITPQNSGKIIT
jgi:hypothetical protein